MVAKESGAARGDDGMKFRKRPLVVAAEQWFPGAPVDGVVLYDDLPPCPKTIRGCPCVRCVLHSSEAFSKGEILAHAWVHTLEGWLKVYPGDWIVRSADGERRVLCDDVFDEMYESVELAGATT